MSSSAILRRSVVFDDEPLVIDNAFEPEDDIQEEPSLLEVLQQEHPDTEPEEIEDALQEAIDSLMAEAPPGSGVPSLAELQDDEAEEIEAEGQTPEALITPPPAPDTEALLAEARRQAEQIVSAAKAEAQQVLAGADERAAEIERAAYDKGYGEGLQSGKAAGEEQAANMLTQVTSIIDEAARLHDSMLLEAEPEMVALCLEIARKIIQAELRTNPDVVKSVLGAAVQRINGAPRVKIKVNPAQLEMVRDHWQRAFGAGYREKEWAIEADANVYPGGCLLETKYGSLDAQIGAQFAEIQKTFALLLGTS